jgi:hypothetical protein
MALNHKRIAIKLSADVEHREWKNDDSECNGRIYSNRELEMKGELDVY